MTDFRRLQRNHTYLLRTLVAGSVLALGVSAHAGDLSVADDEVIVENPGGDFGPNTYGIAANGIIDDVTGIPTSGDLDFPTFSFTLQHQDVVDGDYTFRGGFTIDDDNSDRRLEISIPAITMSFTGGVLDGSVAANQSVTVLGRSGDGSFEVSAIVNNNLASFTGASVSFNAANQLALIADEGGLLGDIVATIDNAASGNFTYGVFLIQTGGPANIRFGRNAVSLSPFPCTDGSPFQINGGSLAGSYSGAYGLQGQLEFAGAAGPQAAAPTPFDTACAVHTPPSGGGGGGGGGTSLTEVNSAINDIEIDPDEPVTEETILAIETALDDAAALADETADLISSGSASVDSGLTVITTLGNALTLIGEATQAGATLDADAVVDTIAGIATLLEAITNQPVNEANVADTQLQVETLLASVVAAISADTPEADAAAIMQAVTDMVNSALGVPGVVVSLPMAVNARTLSETTLERQLANIGDAIGQTVEFVDSETTQALLADNPTLLGRVLDMVSINLDSSLPLDITTSSTALENAGLSSSDAAELAELLAQFPNPDGVSIATLLGTNTGGSILSQVVGGADAEVDSTTGQVNVGDIAAFVSRVILVPASVPDGITVLPDGSALGVTDGVGVVVVPAPYDIVSFAGGAVLADSEIDVRVEPSGRVRLDNGEFEFSGTFSFTETTPGTGGTGETVFVPPEGDDPTSPDYAWQVQYPDGTTQDVLPFVTSDTFYDSVAEFGFDVSTDRYTGILTIGGANFRPDYFVTPLTEAESTYLGDFADENGNALLETEINGDGITDYKLITSAGVQIIYGLP